MSENKEELNALINEMHSKLTAGATIELIDDEAREQQSQPGQSLPDELLAEISQAAAALARELFGDEAVIETSQMTQISPMDGSVESRQAVREMVERLMPRRRCYHYILNDRGEPVHTEDDEEVEAFQERRGDILAEKHFKGPRGSTFVVTAALLIHNEWDGQTTPPSPQWITLVSCENDGSIGWQYISRGPYEALRQFHYAVRETRRTIAHGHRLAQPPMTRRKIAGQRKASPVRREVAQRRIAAGLDVLRRKPTKESNDHWMKRIVNEAFGDMEGHEVARVLGLPDLRRKRGIQ